jgi:hypothetical protein
MIRVDYALGRPLSFTSANYVRAKDIVRCTKQMRVENDQVKMQQNLPFFIITVKQPGNEQQYVVHSEDNWKMERLINGTFHPIAALVDELQNHPSIGILPKLAAAEFAQKAE